MNMSQHRLNIIRLLTLFLAGYPFNTETLCLFKISEGCNHRCTFCIIPSMRGDLVSRPVGSVLEEAAALKRAGVKEILVISQDTSAYGVDTKYKLDFWNGQPVKPNSLTCVKHLVSLEFGFATLCISISTC